MQNASAAYRQAMKDPLRNRGYIKAKIGVINREAQKTVTAKDKRNNFAWFSDIKKPFDDYAVERIYATFEQDFTKLDGSMYFMPDEDSGMETYNQGIVTEDIRGKVYINFGGRIGLDIKGLTIDFGHCYPTRFTVESDSDIKTYGNDKDLFVTEDVFLGTSYFIITPLQMVNGEGRLRIYQFSCGIVNVFTNEEVKSYTFKETASSITEKLPSMNMSLTVDNQNLYYSPDNPDSALAFMETGQPVEVSFGYDVTGNGDIEWIEPNVAYLKAWSANDKEAKFTATDTYSYEMTDKYKRGLYRAGGISLYDLAMDVLNDAGVTDERDYFIDPYLKKVIVNNPMPVVKHSEALQIIANAGRCALTTTRRKKIQMRASFVPDSTVSVNNKADYGDITNLLKNTPKEAYAVFSHGFTKLDGSMKFMPDNPADYLENGYVSDSVFYSEKKGTMIAFELGAAPEIQEEENNYWIGEVPEITINYEAAWMAYGLLIKFRNVAPLEFRIITYRAGAQVQDITVQNPEVEYVLDEEFEMFDKMVLRFTKGPRNSRLFVDSILIDDITGYTITRTYDMYDTPTAVRQDKIKEIVVTRTAYRPSAEAIKDLKTEEISLKAGVTEKTVDFTKASYGFAASIADNAAVTVKIIGSSSYYATLRFNAPSDAVVKYAVKGYEYAVDEQALSVPHSTNGVVKTWKNPLISTVQHAQDLEEWLASYFLGDVDYQISWRGDARVDSNDLFYIELKDRPNALIRAYENNLTYNGAWKADMKARKAVAKWQ